MKKFYTFALAASVAVSGFATTFQTAPAQLPSMRGANMSAPMVESHPGLTALKAPAKAPAQFSSLQEFEGVYTWNYFSMLDDDFGPGEMEVAITIVDEEQGKVSLNVFNDLAIEAYVDLAAGTFTIPNRQDLFMTEDGETVEFYFKEAGANGWFLDGASEAPSVTGVFTSTEIVFDTYSIWAVGMPDNELGYYMLTYMNSITLVEEEEIDEFDRGWYDYCTGTFVDGWIIPGYYDVDADGNTYHLNPEDYPWTVTVQKSETDPYLYRLYDPYHAETCPIREDASAGKKGAIVFSVEDPDFVLVLPEIYSGYDNGANGLNLFNIEGLYFNMGATKEYIREHFNGFVDSRVEGQTVIFNQCRFNFEGALDKVYYWNGCIDLMHGSVTLSEPLTSGIESVAVENANTQAEYFNLQGVRVAEPAAGNVYIVRQNGKTAKMLMR